MPTEGRLPPAAPAPRIEALDVLRGLAILGIFFINIPIMGGPIVGGSTAPSRADQAVSWGLDLFVEGTQRGLLQLLFGAGMLLLTARAMRPDGPVAVADSYYRRNLWLLAIGLVHIFVLLWPFDILHVYAIAALFLFPFRRIGPRLALALGLGYCALTFAVQIAEPSLWEAAPPQMEAQADTPDADAYAGLDAAAEREARHGGYLATQGWSVAVWSAGADGTGLWSDVAEAFAVMLVGMALFKWGIVQGLRSGRFYLVLTVAAYGVGVPLRLGALVGDDGWSATYDIARLAISIGHVALVNLALRSRAGEWLLRPFRAAGRMAFTLYLMQTMIGLWVLFPSWGFGLWDRFGPAGLALVAASVAAIQVLLANLWLRRFSAGPVEWAWRSLAAWRPQPFRRQASGAA